MEVYPIASPADNVVRRRRSPGGWSLRRRIARTWDRNKRSRSLRWSRYRAKLEKRATRALADAPALVASLRRRARERPEETRAADLADALSMITPDGIGLIRCTRQERREPGQGARYYAPRRAWPMISAAVALVDEARKLLAAIGRATYRSMLWARAALARRGRRSVLSDQYRDHPYPAVERTEDKSSVSLGSAQPVALLLRVGTASADDGDDWLRRYRERFGATEGAETA